MRQSTVDALNALNLRFYETVTEEFHQSRKTPWPGFGRALSTLPEPPASVLDIGCGDGRFGAYLQQHVATPFTYVGIDYSAALLRLAEQRGLGPHCRFVTADVARDDFQPPGNFALIVVLGVMHHVPSLALRKALLMKLASRLVARGSLVLTFWRLPGDPRFERRVQSVDEYNVHAQVPIPASDLETGDTLLRWGQGDGPPRYCHFVDDAEIAALCEASGLQRVASFKSDGRGDALNEYVVLRAAG